MREPLSSRIISCLLAFGAVSGLLCAAGPASAEADNSVVDAGTPDAAAQLPATSTTNEATESSKEVAASESLAAEAELAAVMSDVPTITADAPSLQIYGFADLNVGRPYVDKQSLTHDLAPSSAFAVGNVNLYVASNLTHGFSSLLEVRFTYMPAGTFDPSGKVQTTYATDASSYGRSDRWGGIILQRIHLDYSYNGLFNVRVGQFLTPYGIWNVDHGSPTVISTIKPYPIGNAYFPERQVGLELFGTYLVKNVTLGYHLTVSNGRGDVDTLDLDKNKALGGRLFVATDAMGAFKFGVSAYGGRATRNVSVGIGADADGQTQLKLVTTNQYDEFAVACDLLWEWKNLRIQGEGILSQIRYTDDGRRLRTTQFGAPIGLVADHLAYAWYGLVGYRLPWLSIMPYVLVDYFHQAPGSGSDNFYDIGTRAVGYNFGLNVRPVPSVVLKAQVTIVRTPPSAQADTTIVGGQAAWAF